MQIPEATKLPIRAEEPGDFSTTILYSLPKVSGIYRRVARDGRTGKKVGDGHVLADAGDSFCELVRWTEGEQLLRPLLPGVESPNPDQEDDPLEGGIIKEE